MEQPRLKEGYGFRWRYADSKAQKPIDRLAAYEDTNLTPSDIADMKAEVESLRSQLKRKCQHEADAVKCIYDIETYLELGSAKYIKQTIDDWRGLNSETEVANGRK